MQKLRLFLVATQKEEGRAGRESHLLSEALSRCEHKASRHIVTLKAFLFSFFFLGPHPRHMEVPRLGVQAEL